MISLSKEEILTQIEREYLTLLTDRHILPEEEMLAKARKLPSTIQSAGENINNLEQRQQLESYASYWDLYIYKITNQYSKTSLLEPKEPLEDTSSLFQDWGEAPDVTEFVGRTEELTKLKKWIVEDRCRVVAIVGIAGIGKTFLARKLAEEIKTEFDYIIWRSLLNAPLATEILTDIIKFLSSQQATDLPNNIDAQIVRLLSYLKEQRCLLILDNAETILQSDTLAGQYRKGYEGYSQLFERAGETDHQSCLLLTGREKPKNLERLEGKTEPVRFLELGGLAHSEAREIFTKTLSVSDDKLTDLIESYNGNPLAIELAARHIKDVFSGNISEFLKRKKTIFGDLRELLNWSFNRLSEPEKEVMYWLAINHEPVSLETLKEDILSIPNQAEIPSSIQSLQRRLPLQKSRAGFTLQPVLMEYMTERLIEQVCAEIESRKLEIFNSHALIKATGKEYVRASQTRLIIKPILDRLLGNWGSEKKLEAQLKEIISLLQKQTPNKPGYAAGNLLNLLCHQKTTLSNYNFSNLTIWQADLQGKKLHRVNFANSQIDKSIFTQTFGNILSVSFRPDGKLFATGDSQGEIRLWQVTDGQQVKILKEHTNWVRSVAFSPDGRTLAIGSEDGVVKLWDVALKKWRENLLEMKHQNRLWSVTFSYDSKFLASGSNDGEIKLWDVSTRQCINTLQGHTNWVRSLAFSPDSKTLLSGGDDQTIRLWDVRDVGKAECRKILQGYVNIVSSVAFSPDGKTLASSSEDSIDYSIVIWDDIHSGHYRNFEGHKERIRLVAFSPDGQTLASGSEDFTVRIWRVAGGECLYTLEGHTNKVWSVAFHPDGNILASGGVDRTIIIWDVSNGTLQKSLGGHSDIIRSVAFSPDGQILASGSDDKTIKLWDVNTGQCSRTLQEHTNCVRSVVFKPKRDELTLASGGQDGTIRLWKVETGECLKTLTNPRPYEGTNIAGVTGLNRVQKEVLEELGAVEEAQVRTEYQP